ncbi:MAG: hypothetical protein HUJ99_01235 [Bacteroidaceae bacterium]|nr:hypothetical protein [Bacteroidaceae bacterium]
MKKLFLLLSLVVSVVSCSTTSLSVLQYDQLSPASVSLPQEIKKVAVVDRVNGVIRSGQNGLPVDTKTLSDYLAKQLADADYFDDIILCDSDISTLDREETKIAPLSQEHVQFLTEDLDVDMLVSIENASASFLNTLYMPIVSVKAIAKIYIPTRSGALRSLAVSDTISWDNGFGELTLETMQHDVLAFLSEKLAHQIAPYWEPAERLYYTGGNAGFRDAEFFLKKGDWDQAIQLWEGMLPSAKGTTRLQTLYNLSLAKEMIGDLDGALQDCEKLVDQSRDDFFMHRLSTDYRSVLKHRIANQQVLNLQMQRFDE